MRDENCKIIKVSIDTKDVDTALSVVKLRHLLLFKEKKHYVTPPRRLLPRKERKLHVTPPRRPKLREFLEVEAKALLLHGTIIKDSCANMVVLVETPLTSQEKKILNMLREMKKVSF